MRKTLFLAFGLLLGCGSSSALDAPSSSAEQPLACAATGTSADDACAAASRYRVELVHAQVQGTTGSLSFRYRNASTTAPWAYPTARITSDDERVASAPDGPDLYGLETCTESDVIEHSLSLSSPIASGTTLHFTLTPTLIDEHGSQCALVGTTFEVVVP